MFILSIFSTYIVESTGMNKEILIVNTQTICNWLWASKYNINCNDSTINNCVCLSIHKKWQPVNVFRPMFIWNQQRQVTNDIDGFSNAFGRNVTATFFEKLPLMASQDSKSRIFIIHDVYREEWGWKVYIFHVFVLFVVFLRRCNRLLLI